MATAKANACFTLTIGTGDDAVEYRIHEGDTVTDLAYRRGQDDYTVSGTVRVINASVQQSNYQQTCPPESYFHRLATINSVIIDCSEKYDADLVTVTISEITGVGSVTEGGDDGDGGDEDASITVGPGVPYQSLDTIINGVDAGSTIKLEPGTYTPNLTISKAMKIIGQEGVTLTGSISIDAGDGALVTLQDLAIAPATVAAASAAVDVKSGDLEMTGSTINTKTSGEEACGIRKDSVASGKKSTITLTDCAISINEDGTGSGFAYPIALGRFDTSASIGTYDMGDCDLTLTNCTITGNVAAGQTYGIYSASRGIVNINIDDCTMSAWAAVYMNRNGQTETNGNFQSSFAGGSITVNSSTLTGIQNYAASGSVESDVNDFAPLVVQNSQNTKIAVTNSTVAAKNSPTTEDKTFAPMHLVSISATKGVTLDVSNCTLTIENPVVAKAIIADTDTQVNLSDNTFTAVDAAGKPIESECVLY